MATNFTQEAVALRVEEIIQEHIGTDETLTLETHLQDDLAVDSLERVELGIKLEKAFGIVLTNDKLRTVSTLGDFIQLIVLQVNLPKEVENRV